MDIIVVDTNNQIFRDAAVFKGPSMSSDEENETKEFSEPENSQQLRKDHRCKINTRPLSKHAQTYQLENFDKNAMIIFNHENVEGLQKRIGTDKDVAALKETFAKFDFDIECHKDLKKVEVLTKLKKFSEKDFTDYGCVVVVVLTHGTGHGLLRANDDGQLYSELEIIQHFKSRDKLTLVSKPIIVIIQACRGQLSTHGVAVKQNLRVHKDYNDEWEPYYLPLESDMLVVHSSYVGKPSFRPASGSWFIQTLCKKINELAATHDFESILTEVKREVAIDKYYAENNRRTGEIDINKQMPVVTSALIRKLYLKKYNNNTIHRPIATTSTYGDSTTNLSVLGKEASSAVPCSCFLKHFDYMKWCLSNFVTENPDDRIAWRLLKLADIENETDTEKLKDILATISDYLESKKSKYNKYIHFYNDRYPVDITVDDNNTSYMKFSDHWLSKNSYILLSVGFVGSTILYSLFKK